ncbi:SET domain-containing protein SmydA-8-like [Agrilus planipennis]|uniref:SET domain-containing protein SmydA-8-like n=1 Tax=Agrilus planipennis TaxID=224129 RepID=A0A1W4WHY5_AGRPL|nr:SET domain-containing protein SmydA-8-like [Agrilus planipennis]
MSLHRRRRQKSRKGSDTLIPINNNNNDDENSSKEKKEKELNFRIKNSKVMGRYMVAARYFEPGEIIVSETPLVVGPCTGCKVQCLGCYQTLNQKDKYHKCKNCGWPLCSPKCSGISQYYGHSTSECNILKETKSSNFLNYANFDDLKINLHALVPLRCLLLKSLNPSGYEKLMNMEAHNEIRANIPEVWNGNQKTVVEKIRNDWGLLEYTEEEIHTICGILEVNAFEIGQNGVNIRGLYPSAFLLSHDCVPNTNHNDEEKDFRLTIRASLPISKNQPITLSYAYTLQGTLKRREHLLENKFFECMCKRCSDPTELGTFTSALRCPKCEKGWVLSTNPLDPEAAWSCNNSQTQESENRCPGYRVTAKSMKLLINRITQEVDSIDCNDIERMEEFLEKYRNVLHPSHYLCLGVKLSLSQLYGKINGYLINELTDEQLTRKREICREIMKIFDIIEPGYTRLRGVTLYELHAPIMILTTRQYEQEDITKSELRRRLKEVVKCLEQANIILGSESPSSAEGMMGIAAKDALEKIRNWEKIIGKF